MNPITAFILTAIHLLTFFLYQLNYARLRRNKKYTGNETGHLKDVVERMPLAKLITKLAYTLGTILVTVSFWIPHEMAGFFQGTLGLRLFGLGLTFLAFLMLQQALFQLGRNYSPLFDTHRPHEIVKSGLYRYIRHPVYLCNMIILLGYVFSGLSVWVVLTSCWGWIYMLISISKEEKYLAMQFPEYQEYQKKTWRLVPYVF